MKTNTPNPLVPQGSLPDRRSKSQVRIYIFTIVAIHAVFLGALLLQGCKPTTTNDGLVSNMDTNVPPPPIDPSTLSQQSPAQAETVQTTSAPPAIETTQFASPATQTQNVIPPPLDVTPPPQPVMTSSSAGGEHVVVAGDVYSKIARKYGVTVRALTEANPGVNPTRLKIGQKLVIPGATAASATPSAAPAGATSDGQKTYVVKSGDNLMKIARTHGTTVKALRSANQLKTDQIKVGQKLIVPAKGTPDTGVGGTSGAPQTLPAP